MNIQARSNDEWLTQLRSRGPDQQKALSDLRESLLRGLRRGLSARAALNEAFLEDAVQNSLLRILERLEQFQGRSRFLTWATSIAIRVALSDLRRRRWKDASLDEVTDSGFTPLQVIDLSPGPDIRWQRRTILDKMNAVIQSELTEKQRTVLIAELRGMPQEEIARHLGSNRNAVYKLTHDARKRLKKGLEAAGYDAGDVQAAFAN